MTLQQLLNTHRIYLHSYEPNDKNYYSTCPECSHTRQLGHQKLKCLSIKIDAKGATWHCHHCGWNGPEKSSNGRGGDFAATYNYRDTCGVLRFQKVRKLPGAKNRFFMRRPDGHGGWESNTKGVDTSLLYRIDEVTKAIAVGRRIAVVEGEKDVDNLWAIGIPATCNAHGASEPGKAPKWTAKHSAQLRGADLVVFNDNDQPGYDHANAICRLSHRIAARVRRLDFALHWPDMPKGADVSNWLEAGHTREELEALMEAAPEAPAGPGEADEDNDRAGHGVPQYSDDVLAVLAAERHRGDLRFVVLQNRWLVWKDCKWATDATATGLQAARAVCREQAAEAASRNQMKVATALASAKTIAAVEKLTKIDPSIAVAPDQFDVCSFDLHMPDPKETS